MEENSNDESVGLELPDNLSEKAKSLLVKQPSFMGAVQGKLNLDSFEVPGVTNSSGAARCDSSFAPGEDDERDYAKWTIKFRVALVSVVGFLVFILALAITIPTIWLANDLSTRSFDQCFGALANTSMTSSKLVVELGEKDSIDTLSRIEQLVINQIIDPVVDVVQSIHRYSGVRHLSAPNYDGKITGTFDEKTYANSMAAMFYPSLAYDRFRYVRYLFVFYSDDQVQLMTSLTSLQDANFTFCPNSSSCHRYGVLPTSVLGAINFTDVSPTEPIIPEETELYRLQRDQPSDHKFKTAWDVPFETDKVNSSDAGNIRLMFSYPLGNCGYYRCFGGIQGAMIQTYGLSCSLQEELNRVKNELRQPVKADTDLFESEIFIIYGGLSDNDHGGGYLLSSSSQCNITDVVSNQHVTNATDNKIRWTGNYILHQLLNADKFTFDAIPKNWSSESSLVHLPSGVDCTTDDIQNGRDEDCYFVSATSLVTTHNIDSLRDAAFIIVSVYPEAMYLYSLGQREKETGELMKSIHTDQHESWVTLIAVVLAITVTLILLLTLFVIWFSYRFGRSLVALNSRMVKLEKSLEFDFMGPSELSRIDEVNQMQKAFNSVAKTIEVLEKYVPTSVIKTILRNDGGKGHRLHVVRKNVTILFSDIEGFTMISEILDEQSLLHFLTKYLSIMTQVVESYGGVVGEVLGDGILAFWNTPDHVENHPAKACAAALAMQQCMYMLNDEFSGLLKGLKLDAFGVRIGIHTGKVLTGNIGSKTKMKFGCIGDAVNLASRLEGICKVYGVGICCSVSTISGCPADAFVTRELDLVQVKGKKKPVRIFELCAMEQKIHEVKELPQCTKSSDGISKTKSLFQRVLNRRTSSSLSTSTLSSVPEIESRTSRERFPSSEFVVTYGPVEFFESYRRENIQLYEGALCAYQNGRLGEARGLVQKMDHRDKATQLLNDRISKALELYPDPRDVPDDWTGVLKLDEK